MSNATAATKSFAPCLRVQFSKPVTAGNTFLREIMVGAPDADDIAAVGSLDLGRTTRNPDGSLTREFDRALFMRWLHRLTGIETETLEQVPIAELPKLVMAVARQLVWAAQNVQTKD